MRNAVGGILRIDWQVYRARLGDGQRGDDQVWGLVEKNRDVILCTDPLLDDPVRQSIRQIIGLPVRVMTPLVHDRDGIWLCTRPLGHQFAEGGRRSFEPFTRRCGPQPLRLTVIHEIHGSHHAVRICQYGFEHIGKMPQQLRSHPLVQHRDQILGHHVSAAGLHLHGQTEWNICHMAFECRFFTTDSGRTEQLGRIGSHGETNSRYHAIQADSLMRHPIQGGPPHPGQQILEAFVSAWPHTQWEDVAEVPDAATRMGIEGRHRRGHDEVIGVCVPMQ